MHRLNSLGGRLRSVRELRGLSLNALARNAGISAAYLQKLERDEVKQPSSHILFSLAKQLSVGYGELMQLAGYLVPTEASPTSPNVLAQALDSEPLTEDEVEALARYLAWYRHSRGQGI